MTDIITPPVIKELRTIRSFVRRQGRLTQGQEYALNQYWQIYGLAVNTPLNPLQVFEKDAPLILEIGFGNGVALASIAAENSDTNYLGIEVHKPGVGHLLNLLHTQDLKNVRLYCHDAVEILERNIENNSLTGVHLFFPDPWHKTKHRKRRLVSDKFLALLQQKLQTGGYFHLATDWREYAKWSLKLLSADNAWCNQSLTQDYCERPVYRPLTKFEARGLRLGHGVWDLIFTKV